MQVEIKFKKQAVTLTELLVAVAIIAIVAGLSLPHYTKAIEKQKEKEAFAALEAFAMAENRYYVLKGEYIPPMELGGASIFFDSDGDRDQINPALGTRVQWTGNWEYCIETDLFEGALISTLITRDLPSGSKYFYMQLQYGRIMQDIITEPPVFWCN